jgi:hypothetical protein
MLHPISFENKLKAVQSSYWSGSSGIAKLIEIAENNIYFGGVVVFFFFLHEIGKTIY